MKILELKLKKDVLIVDAMNEKYSISHIAISNKKAHQAKLDTLKEKHTLQFYLFYCLFTCSSCFSSVAPCIANSSFKLIP